MRGPMQEKKILPSEEEEAALVPSWILAPHEDKLVREKVQERANSQCAKQFFEFGQCCKNHQLLFSWKCAQQKQAMVDCISYWGSQDKYLEFRDLYIETKKKQIAAERRLERENGL